MECYLFGILITGTNVDTVDIESVFEIISKLIFLNLTQFSIMTSRK